jgi:hypothetical protein
MFGDGRSHEPAISPEMSACVQVSKTEFDWLIGMSHLRLAILIRPAHLGKRLEKRNARSRSFDWSGWPYQPCRRQAWTA